MASKPFPDHKRAIWRLKYRPDPLGSWKTVTLGKDPRLTGARPPKTPPQFVIDRAREFTEVEYRAKHGMGTAPKRAKNLESYLLAYIDAYGTRRAGSLKQLKRHVASFLAFAKERGIVSLQKVERATCRDYLEFRARSVIPSTLRTERGYLVGIWSRAVEDGLIAANPWAGVKDRRKVEDTPPTFWTPEEIGRIIAACRKPWHKDFVRLLAATGLRISTALAMTWDWIDWGAGMIRIRPGPEVKTAYNHALGPVAREVLEKRRMVGRIGGDLVFPGKDGRRLHYDTARDMIARAIVKAKVKAGTPHDIRHSYARALILNGVPVTMVQKQLGHTTLAMTMRYVSSDEEQTMKFVENLRIGDG